MAWDDLKLFQREAETLRALSHPAIPRYLDSFEVELAQTHTFALVQSYVEAPSLEAHLKAGRTFTEADVNPNRDCTPQHSRLFAQSPSPRDPPGP